MDIIGFLNDNSGAFNLLFSFVVAAATVFYARLTKHLVAETKRMREAQTEPMVSIRVGLSSVWVNLVDLIIENVGVGAAYDIRVQLEPDFELASGRFLSELGIVKRGMRYLAPKQAIRTFLTNMMDDVHKSEGKWKDLRFAVVVTYRNAAGREMSERYHIDLAEFEGLSTVGTPPLERIAKAVEMQQEDLRRMISGSVRPRRVCYSPDDIRKETESRSRDRQLRDS